jgi:hypothetical protein
MQADPSSSIRQRVADEGSDREVELEVTRTLGEALRTAAIVNRDKDQFDVSFTSLFIGMLATDDPTAEWALARLRTEGGWHVLLERRGVDVRALQQWRNSKAGPRTELLLRSRSARAALDEGARLAGDLGQVLDIAHVLAAYLTLPNYHPEDFRALALDRAQWASGLGAHLARRFPEQAGFWTSFAQRAFPQAKAAQAEANAAFDVAALDMEPHVEQALRLAQLMAGDKAFSAVDVLVAVATQASSSGSRAFQRFVDISGLEAETATTVTLVRAQLHPSPALVQQFEFAARADPGTTATHRLWGRDLITAALLADDPSLASALDARGVGLDDLRDRWFRFVTASNESRTTAQWRTWWRFAGVDLPRPAPTGIATETDEGVDRLGVADEASAFARLIMDTAVTPPLSIGLLGDWGSGKSFFMQQVRKQISSLRDAASPGLCRNVVEIEFNAWHAADANLWASLVTHIFDRIWEQVRHEPTHGDREAARAELHERINQARGALHEAEVQVSLARDALAAAETDLEARRKQLAWRGRVQAITKSAVSAYLTQLGFKRTLETIVDIEHAALELRESSNRLRLAGSALLERPVHNIGLPVGMVVLLSAVVWFGVEVAGASHLLTEIAQWLSASIGTLAALVVPLQLATRKVSGFAAALETVRTEYDDATSGQQSKLTAEEQTDLERARREFSSAEASVVAARDRLAQLLERQSAEDPRRRLGSFLEERVQSSTYRSQQGIISLVHKDFSELAGLMRELRESATSSTPTTNPASAIRPFDRIVLYVDDLDRCQPAQVVAMLEAVHLLLALDLFVVVVAVDSRWLTRSLEVHYASLFGTRDGELRRTTPQNYLEKIFQITYALRPMDPRHFGGYVAALANAAEAPVTPEADPVAPQPVDASSPPAPSLPAAAGSGGDTFEARGAVRDTAGAAAGTPETGPAPPRRVMPRAPVRIDSTERRYIEGLVALLPTPRIAKRLVNVYRLIKANKDAEAQAAARARREDCATLLMLAVLFGRPNIAADLMRQLVEHGVAFQEPSEPLCSAMDVKVGKLEHELKQASTTSDVAASHLAEWRDLAALVRAIDEQATVGMCAAVVLEVARYSLVTGHEWHTWRAA